MEQIGVITGATIHINYKIFGYKAVAHILVNVEPPQEDQLIEYLKKLPEVFGFWRRGIKGNIDTVTILKTLEQLNDFKDAIKKRFSVLGMNTAIWTDVREMNSNLSIISGSEKNTRVVSSNQTKMKAKDNVQTIVIDQIDQKMADKLSENGRVPLEILGKDLRNLS